VVFDHLLVREALLRQTEGLRAAPRLHQTAAEVKASYHRAKGLQAPLTEIARHWAAAGEAERYRAVLLEAAQAMQAKQERRRARDLYRELLRALPVDALASDRLALWLSLAEVEEELGELGPCEDHLRLAAELAQARGEALAGWTALDGLARVLAAQDRLDEAQEAAARAVQVGRQREDQRLLLRSLLTLGAVAARRHEKRAAGEIQREIRGLLGTVREPSLVARARLLIGDLAHERGDLDGAELHLTAAREGFEEASHPQGLSDALVSLGALALHAHRFDEAEKRWTKALQLKEELADRRGAAQVQALLGQAALQREALTDAERRLKAAEAQFLALRARKEAARVQVYLGALQARMGDPGAATATLRHAQQALDAAHERRGVAHALTCLGVLAVEERELGQARALFRRARQVALPEGPTPELHGAVLQLALVAAWDGELAAAARMLRELLSSAGVSRDQATTAKAALGVLLLLEGREREAEEALAGPSPLETSPWPTAADRFWHGCATFLAVVLRQGGRLADLTPHGHRLNTLGTLGAPQWLAWLHGALGGIPEDAPANLRQDALDGLEALRTLLRVPSL
jgi:tetratricopeptide (TPR) repeat protein